MKKNGEDLPTKKQPSDAQLAKLANTKPRADMDTAYQDNKGKVKTDAQQKKPVKK